MQLLSSATCNLWALAESMNQVGAVTVGLPVEIRVAAYLESFSGVIALETR